MSDLNAQTRIQYEQTTPATLAAVEENHAIDIQAPGLAGIGNAEVLVAGNVAAGGDDAGLPAAATVTPAAQPITEELPGLFAGTMDLISLLRDIRPNYGAVGSRDVDVTAQRQKIDAAIALLTQTRPVHSDATTHPCGGRDYCSRHPFCGCGSDPLFPERDASKPAEQQGLFRKFDVRRVDGSDQPGAKHYGCRYFVLDLDHDQHAPAAMSAYAVACASTHPALSADLKAEFASSSDDQGTPTIDINAQDLAPKGWDAEFLSKRLARVAKAVNVPMPDDMTHEQIADVAGTILGEIARKLEAGHPPKAKK